MKHSKITDLMVREVAWVRTDTPFKEVAELLKDRRVNGMPVVDDDHRVVGVVSIMDLLPKESEHEPSGLLARLALPSRRQARAKAQATVAGELMTAPAITVGEDESVVHAAKLLEQHQITRLPVVDGAGRLVGILGRGDMLQVFLRPDEDVRDEVVHEIFEHELGMTVTPATVSVRVRDGVVHLSGQLEYRSQIPAAVALTHQVDGVIDVIEDLTWTTDDRHGRPGMPDTTQAHLAVRRNIR
ncbi:CBS domain-containing protein [Actinophytocola sp.]|uniref:CBS domain-containing protein n=1 Tax=Actinophytocola sp. TaxID=1872138 RepID=UPI002D7E3DC5|nr:CBS domain-containing protein [Actinophytocola sp.]HET9138138.1 CBS domain-containing protein [Actinophytocola sp.]